MRSVCFAIALVGLAHAQTLPEVQPPVGVDVNVESVNWHPYTGNALTYVKPEKQGKGIGVFAFGRQEGDVVLHLGEKDRYEIEWFENQPLATIIVYRDIVQDGAPMIEASVYLADAVAGEGSKLWSQAFPAKEGVSVDVDCSPKLRHAIYRVQSGKQSFHMVLPSSGNRLVMARDLDQAVQEGLSGPSWSVDGTAIYGGRSAVSIGTQPGAVTISADNDAIVAKALTVQFQALEVSSTFKFKLKTPVPAVGAAVMELMPSNPVLRQVRFKGEWQRLPGKPTELELATRPTNMQLGPSSFTANSLWLVHKRNKGQGFLLSAHAQQSWFAPQANGVAYLTDGALFVRAFK